MKNLRGWYACDCINERKLNELDTFYGPYETQREAINTARNFELNAVKWCTAIGNLYDDIWDVPIIPGVKF